VRYSTDWNWIENHWFWKIPNYLPSTLEIFFIPGHHNLPQKWISACLLHLPNLLYFDYFIVNNDAPRVSIDIIYQFAKYCHKIRYIHLNLNANLSSKQYNLYDNTTLKNGNESWQECDDSDTSNDNNNNDYNEKEEKMIPTGNEHVVFIEKLMHGFQFLFENCLNIQKVYLDLPLEVDPSLLLQHIVYVQLPKNRKRRLKINECKIGGNKLRRFQILFN